MIDAFISVALIPHKEASFCEQMEIIREIHNRSKCRDYGIMECLTLNDTSAMQPIHPRLRKKIREEEAERL